MSIITISRGSYSRGKEVAEKLAKKLGYRCISREILLEASDKFHIPEIKLARAIHDAPSILDRFTRGKETYVAFIRDILLQHVKNDNVVYHGLAGHFFLQQVPHVLKVRIIADPEDRVKEEMRRENISEEDARYIIKKDDDERRKWGLHLYGADTWDSSLYDIVLHVKTMMVEDAVNILANAAKLSCFQTTSESQQILDNLVLTSQLQSILVNQFTDVNVTVRDGVAFIAIKDDPGREQELTNKIRKMVENIPGITDIRVNIVPVPTASALRSAYKMLHFE
ncbi:Cytidylate kinase [uncultured Desulfobacterium sp.]|uniref:Cytidylate kinase n=1 Tax=uncultured Desulfobacterium sp. TaxID=201089 RepID=A0A445N2B3_9BACT|nr:Cytidylate kinase [uncultured Desulfobacterium sp.]